MNRTLLSFCCCVAILFFANTNLQAQAPLYSKYDTLVIGIAGVSMNLTAASTTTHNVLSDMTTWANVTNTDNKISVEITETNDTYAERFGHIYVRQGLVFTDTIVFIQPGRACEKGIEGTAGKRFWVSFLENILATPTTFKLELVATSSQGATGTVTNPNTGYSSTFTVPANETTTLPINTTTLRAQAYNSVGEKPKDLALFVETDENITLYALNYENLSSDAANILPVEALGDEYYTLSYNSNRSNATTGTPEEFLIVATENNTLITIVPAAQTGDSTGRILGKTANDPYRITLQKGQSYLVKALMNDAVSRDGDYFYKSITGTYIKSNKSIAVFSGHKRAKIGCDGDNSRDNLYDQLRPIHLWGHRYAVISTGQPKDLYRVLAAHDNTIITIDGVPQTLNRTDYFDDFVDEEQVVFIESDKPISVAQMGLSQDCMSTASYGDPYLLLLNPVENQIFDITFTPFPSNVISQHFVTILVGKENKSLTQLTNKNTGNPVSLNFKDIAGQDYSYAVTNINPVTHSIHNDKGFIAYAFGYGGAESYAYSVGARFNTLAAPDFDLDTAYCIGATPIKQFSDTLDAAHGYNWYDSPSDTATPLASIPIISTTVVGEFVYYLSKTVECSESPRRKITITIHPLPVIVFDNNLSTICNTPDFFEIATPTGGTYTCPFGCIAGYFYPRTATFGTYPITYTYEDMHGCVSTADTIITVLPIVANPTITAGGHTVFCDGDSVVLTAIASDAHTYQWLRSGDTIVGATTNTYTAFETGTYTLAIRGAHECASDSASNAIGVIAYELPEIPVIAPAGPISLCAGDSILLVATSEGALEYQWYLEGVLIPGAISRAYSANQTGEYTVAVRGEGSCPAEDISNKVVVVVHVLPDDPVLTPQSTTEFCKGLSVILQAVANNALTYEWYRDSILIPAASGDTYSATMSGNYYVKAIGSGNCYAEQTSNEVVVTVYELPTDPIITPSDTINLCDGESELLTVTSARAVIFQWYRNGAPIYLAESSTYSAYQPGSYTVQVSTIEGCVPELPSNVVFVTVTPLPETPVLTWLSALDFCKGSSVDLVAISRNADNYEWYKDSVLIDGVTGDTYTAYETGNYYVKALGVGSCYAQFLSNEVRVIVRENPLIPNIYSSTGPPFYYGVDYTLKLDPVEDGVRYEWYKDSVYLGVYGRNYFISILKDNDAGVYFVEAINEYCMKRSPDFLLDPIEMPDLFIPNVFTPNGDGINDNFRIVGLEAFIENELTVVNNRGKLIYSKKNYNNTWYGEGQPDDIYYYTFRVVSPDGTTITHRGYVYIKRTK